jgi:ubiquitin C-terminal hydrolase
MNSTLQCLAHTGPLRSYFLSGEFAHDLNKDNPLGTGGELALEFAKLLEEMWGTKNDNDDDDGDKGNSLYSSHSRNGGYRRTWSAASGSSNVVYPRDFKYTLGKHAEQFMGYNQHDSQELATYLLDALHEDTNRISKKPYVEKPEQGENEPDYDAANRAWDLHLKREDSRVMDNFMGQVKSRVECPVQGCGRVSTTFDPFMYLSVPLPGASERTIEIDYYSMDPQERVKKFKVTLPKIANCAELRKRLASMINEFVFTSSSDNIMAENIVLGEKFQKEIYTYYDRNDEIGKIRESDLVVAFEVASVSSIHDEIKTHEQNNPRPVVNDDLNEYEQLDERPYGRLQLDVSTMTKLNRGEEWETRIIAYLEQPTFFATLMNPKRKKVEERKKFHRDLKRFVNRCYASPECTNQLRGRVTPSSDLELESCDGNDSEDGKMSPTSTVATQLSATAVDDESTLSLRELCAQSSTFRNIETTEDVATLEFFSKKLLQHLRNEKEVKKIEHTGGAEIQIVFRRNTRGIRNQSQTFASPLVLRISPTLTVFGLREMLSNRLSRVLQPTNSRNAVNEVTKEEKIDMNDEMDCGPDQNNSYFPNCSEALNLMRQIPMTYERGGSGYTSYRYTSKGNSYRKLGSISTHDDNTTSQRSMFARPDDEEEKELVLDHVGSQGKVNLCFVTSTTEKMFNDEEWTKVETISDPNAEDNESKVTSVTDCISKYCQIEQLEDSEMWYCSRCKEHVRAWKQFHLYRTPPILIIHLKRFHYSALTHRRDKIDSFIDFPLEGLDLSDEVKFSEVGKEPIYDCYAVSNHFGGLGGGHYTAYALNDDGEWCNFDDSRVTTNVDISEVISKSAYVLYYKRRDVKTDNESWINRALPSSCSREPSPVTADMDIEGGDTDNNIYGMNGDI